MLLASVWMLKGMGIGLFALINQFCRVAFGNAFHIFCLNRMVCYLTEFVEVSKNDVLAEFGRTVIGCDDRIAQASQEGHYKLAHKFGFVPELQFNWNCHLFSEKDR